MVVRNGWVTQGKEAAGFVDAADFETLKRQGDAAIKRWIDISKIKDLQGNESQRCGEIPKGYSFYLWNKDVGYKNMDDWIEAAARQAGR